MNLLYSYAFGHDTYADLAQVMVTSARQAGFTDQIIILCDKERKFDGADCVVLSGMAGKLWRTSLPNTGLYEKIIYCDTDIRWLRNPAELYKHEKIAISRSNTRLSGNMIASHFLTDGEKGLALATGMTAINSGVVVIPGSLAPEFLNAWRARWESFDFSKSPKIWGEGWHFELWDECALQTMCIRNEIDWEFIEDVVYPVINGYSSEIEEFGAVYQLIDHRTICLHFAGLPLNAPNKDVIREWMKTPESDFDSMMMDAFNRTRNEIKASSDTGMLKKEIELLKKIISAQTEAIKFLAEREKEEEAVF